jgi:hypothetical protein
MLPIVRPTGRSSHGFFLSGRCICAKALLLELGLWPGRARPRRGMFSRSETLSPRSKPPLSCIHLVRLRGASRSARWRDEARCPRGLFARQVTRAASGLRPCPLRGPARSWLTTVRPIPNAARPSLRSSARQRGTYGESAARRRQITASAHVALSLRCMSAHGAPRGARRIRRRMRSHRFALFGAPSPRDEGRDQQSPDAHRVAVMRSRACTFHPSP